MGSPPPCPCTPCPPHQAQKGSSGNQQQRKPGGAPSHRASGSPRSLGDVSSTPRLPCPALPPERLLHPWPCFAPASWPQRPLPGPATLSWAPRGPTKAPCSLSPPPPPPPPGRRPGCLPHFPLQQPAPRRPTGVFGAQERESRCPTSPLLLLRHRSPALRCCPELPATRVPRAAQQLPGRNKGETRPHVKLPSSHVRFVRRNRH